MLMSALPSVLHRLARLNPLSSDSSNASTTPRQTSRRARVGTNAAAAAAVGASPPLPARRGLDFPLTPAAFPPPFASEADAAAAGAAPSGLPLLAAVGAPSAPSTWAPAAGGGACAAGG